MITELPSVISAYGARNHPADRWKNLNRFLSLFFVIIKLLVFLSTAILITISDKILMHILIVNQKDIDTLEAIPEMFYLFAGVILFQNWVICVCGIYGYARLKRPFLGFYGSAMLILTIWLLYIIIFLLTGDNTAIPRRTMFLNFDKDPVARQSVEILQSYVILPGFFNLFYLLICSSISQHHCCGSEYHEFEAPYPKSCCNSSITRQCVPYTNLCETNRTTFFAASIINNTWSYMTIIVFVGMAVSIFEAFLAFRMLWHLDNLETIITPRGSFDLLHIIP